MCRVDYGAGTAVADARAAQAFDELCRGNTYATTIHALNSSIIKLSKLGGAQRVYRGVSAGVPPVRRTPPTTNPPPLLTF